MCWAPPPRSGRSPCRGRRARSRDGRGRDQAFAQFNFAGPYGDDGFLEDYTAQVSGEPIAAAVLVTRNAAGQTQHVAANYRPRSSLLLMSRLLGEKFAGTPYAEYFLAGES